MVGNKKSPVLLGLATAATIALVAVGAGGRAFAQSGTPKHIVSLTAEDEYLLVDVGRSNSCQDASGGPAQNRFFLKLDGKPATGIQASMLLTAQAQNLQLDISGAGLGSCDAAHGEKLNYVKIESDHQNGH